MSQNQRYHEGEYLKKKNTSHIFSDQAHMEGAHTSRSTIKTGKHLHSVFYIKKDTGEGAISDFLVLSRSNSVDSPVWKRV